MSAKLTPFDLEAALRGEPVVTRDGREVMQVTKFDIDAYPVGAVVSGGIAQFTLAGKFLERGDHKNDLFMATKTVKKEGWVIVMPYGRVWVGANGQSIFEFKADAEQQQQFVDKKSVVVKIEWEEEV